jgi:uncharacterized membrane protein (DUF2068 family)
MVKRRPQRSGTTRAKAVGHDQWLIVIGVFKILGGLLLISLGFGLLHFLHRDIADVLLRAATSLRLDPESHLINLLLTQVDKLTPHRMRLISVGIFFYAGLHLTEGTGLVLEKTWAEWFTIGVTASFLPWEIYELTRHLNWMKVALTVINILVLLYLARVQQVRLRQRHA